jgi:hypothetical protein
LWTSCCDAWMTPATTVSKKTRHFSWNGVKRPEVAGEVRALGATYS